MNLPKSHSQPSSQMDAFKSTATLAGCNSVTSGCSSSVYIAVYACTLGRRMTIVFDACQ